MALRSILFLVGSLLSCPVTRSTESILTVTGWRSEPTHFGGRMVFDRSGAPLVTVAQNTRRLAGLISLSTCANPSLAGSSSSEWLTVVTVDTDTGLVRKDRLSPEGAE